MIVNPGGLERCEPNHVVNKRSKLVQLMTKRQRRGQGSKDVTAVECVTNRMLKEFFAGGMNSMPLALLFTNPTEQSVVRAHKKLIGAFDCERSAL